MIVQSWVDVLQQSFANLLASVVAFLPSLVFAVIIFVVGWFIGALVGRVIAQAVRAIKVDQALRSAGVGDIVSRAGYTLDSGRLSRRSREVVHHHRVPHVGAPDFGADSGNPLPPAGGGGLPPAGDRRGADRAYRRGHCRGGAERRHRCGPRGGVSARRVSQAQSRAGLSGSSR